MTALRRQTIQANDSFSIDGFGRWRTSNVETLFDSKQTQTGFQLFWDIATTSGAGTSSTYDKNGARTILGVSNLTAGTIVRQSKQRMNYQPGKSQLILVTFNMNAQSTGISKRAGFFDENNGLFLEVSDDIYIVRRSYVSGVPVDEKVAQDNWNLDPFGGNGPSKETLDITKVQILFIDFEWLGVGRVRMGFVIDGKIYYAHQFVHANLITSVYMSQPNLPVRYEISNNGSGPAATLDTICCSVSSEGGLQRNGILRSEFTGNSGVAISSTNRYALLGIQLKSTDFSSSVILEQISLACSTTNDYYRWEIRLNPTVAGTFTYGEINGLAPDASFSSVQSAIGSSANTVTGGQVLLSGVGQASTVNQVQYVDAYKLGSTIGGVSDKLVLCLYNFTTSLTIHACLEWRELV